MIRVRPDALRLMDRMVVGLILLLTVVLMGVSAARSAEIVPSVGMSRSTSGGGTLRAFGGLAFRPSIIPMVTPEIGIAYRSEPRLDDAVTVKMVPVTASVWVTPLPTFYVGGGVGWYYTKYDYREGSGVSDHTRQNFGTHVGGGVRLPVLPALASVDLNGRYVRLRDQPSPLAPDGIHQSFVSVSLGLAIKI